MHRPRSVFVVALLASALSGQTYVVDAANGPGTNFQDLPPAVAAVPSGAILDVRPGSYSGFTVSGKGLTILGGAGVVVTTGIDIANTQAHQPVTLRDLHWATAQLQSGSTLLMLTSCAGAVTLQRLTQPPHYNCLPGSSTSLCLRTTGVRAAGCAQLHLRDCSLRCTVSLSGSHTVIESCLIEGESYGWYGSTWAIQPGRTALQLSGGDTQLCGNSTVAGGHGNYNSLASAPAGNGVVVSSAGFRAMDGQIRAYYGAAFGGFTVFVAGSSQVRLGTRVGFLGPYGPQVGTDVMPGLIGTDAIAGGNLSATVSSEPGDLVILVVGLSGPSISVPGLQDPFWIDPSAHHFAAIGTQQTGAPVTAVVPVATGNTFVGLRLNWGAACLGPQTGFQATNPVTTLIF